MKNHKFRAWDKDLNQFEYFDFDSFMPCYSIESEFEIQQFTGLFDKNGVPIYEGDIVTCRMQYAQTAIQKKLYAGIVHWNHSYWAVGEYKLFIMDDKDFRVIGNVFQNPELIA